MDRRKRLWFVEPLDEDTSKAIARVVAEELDEKAAPRRVKGRPNPVPTWRCTEIQARYFVRSRVSEHLKFYLYTCLEGDRLQKVSLNPEKNQSILEVRKMVQNQLKRPLKYPPQLVR
ncbi:hypothetical protein KW790_00565 [Candidatus Parcubacteria bacterium]|nr:hypothetical protein [Candidatus Parcubacteria bacterium]